MLYFIFVSMLSKVKRSKVLKQVFLSLRKGVLMLFIVKTYRNPSITFSSTMIIMFYCYIKLMLYCYCTFSVPVIILRYYK